MVPTLVRGILRIVAASSGLLLIFAVIYAMEGMTTRLPTTSFRELLVSVVCMVPWILLFCSGLHDLAQIAKRQWLFWVGSALVLVLVYYFDRNTSFQEMNKAAVPILACIFAILPHTFRRVAFLYSVVSVMFGLCGMLVLVYLIQMYFRGGSYTNRPIATLVFSFAISSIAAGVLSIRPRVHDSRGDDLITRGVDTGTA
ncbi:MAG: hypothetical protein KGN79_16320 [Acidobacteriota bacterium]|nr:hypothetical protein [Acidobacteriota bacterium]